MHVTTEDLVGALRREGLRITAARRAICEVLAQAHEEHLTAADIQRRANTAGSGAIDQSTVYRTLDVLEALGFLHHVHLGHGPGVIHLTEERDHHHLVCERCGRSVDVPLQDLEEVLAAVADHHGFVADSVHFALSGRCRECARG